ncbi:MAG: hypothetical protein ACPF8V_05620, partial [Luteibaculum sp.]
MRFLLLFFFLAIHILGLAQYGESFKKPRYVTENLLDFDYRKYHFGFIIGLNGSDFRVDRKAQTLASDSLVRIENVASPGFNLGIVSTYAFTKNFRIRF